MCNAYTIREIFGPLICCHVINQQCIKILFEQDRDTSSVNATSSIRICEQCHFSFYAPPKVFDRPEFKSDVRFIV
ncbi:hypothetical protein CUMW_203840 [Citrus unshiu]|uniref:Uncharacterized protein n=1 Tax=Citrus unshiu TaxID=55188 RepID=A0A2H5Q7V9_CITUN|nr:hypothetical protein CUMW_203840 [Citrus unshiu]